MTGKIKFILFSLICLLSFDLLFYNLEEEFSASLTLSTLILLLFLFSKTRSLFIPKKFSIFFVFYFLSLITSSILTGFSFPATVEILKTSSIFILVLISVNLFKKNIVNFTKALFPLLIASSFLSLIGILEITGRLPNQKMIALLEPFHFPSNAAIFFLLMTPLSLALYLTIDDKIKNVVLFISLTLLSIAWILSLEYLLVFFFLFIVIIFYFHKRLFISTKYTTAYKNSFKKILLVFLLISILLPNFLLSFGPAKLPKEITLYLDKYLFSNKEDISRFSYFSIKNHFLTGIGPGSFGTEYNHNLSIPFAWSDYAGNELLQTFVETGIVGFISEFLLFSFIIIFCLKLSKYYFAEKNLIYLIISITSVLFLILCLYNNSFRSYPIILSFFFLFSPLLQNDINWKINKGIVSLFLLVIFVISSISLLDSIIFKFIQKKVLKGRNEISRNTLLSLTYRPKFLINPKIYLWLSAIYYEEKKPKEAISYLKKSYALQQNQELIYQIGKLMYESGEKDQAKHTFQNYIFENKYVSPKFYLALSRIYKEENISELSLFWLKKASLVYPVQLDFILSPVTLNTLENKDYLSSIQSIYYALYQSTLETSYLRLLQVLVY